MELYDVFKLEQAYIKSIVKKKPELIKEAANSNTAFDKKELLIETTGALVSFVTKLIEIGLAVTTVVK
jgi:hypothetical protein